MACCCFVLRNVRVYELLFPLCTPLRASLECRRAEGYSEVAARLLRWSAARYSSGRRNSWDGAWGVGRGRG